MAIDNKIEQAMVSVSAAAPSAVWTQPMTLRCGCRFLLQDLVKSHLMLAVREEVELLREQIRELQEKNQHLERENTILRTLSHANTPPAQHTHAKQHKQ